MESVLKAIVLGLLATNALSLYWVFYLFIRRKDIARVRALERAIAAFEREGSVMLEIHKIDQDQIFLRNPGR